MSDPIVEKVLTKFRSRSKRGIDKYGTTLDENNVDDFLVHLQEELMDAVLYIEKLRADGVKKITAKKESVLERIDKIKNSVAMDGRRVLYINLKGDDYEEVNEELTHRKESDLRLGEEVTVSEYNGVKVISEFIDMHGFSHKKSYVVLAPDHPMVAESEIARYDFKTLERVA